VDEVVADGVSGFIVESMDEAVEATRRVDALSRRACRRHFDAAFTAARMAADYLAVYEGLLAATELDVMDRLDAAGQVG
jgi:hypothetical protein